MFDRVIEVTRGPCDAERRLTKKTDLLWAWAVGVGLLGLRDFGAQKLI
jgi:hypothetical protein